jgi:hypothetical protein
MEERVWLVQRQLRRSSFWSGTGADHLRQTKFVVLREDKDSRKVIKKLRAAATNGISHGEGKRCRDGSIKTPRNASIQK